MVEAVTYRWFGHYAGDAAGYRDSDEVTTWRARDPLVRTRAALDPQTAERLDADVEAQIAASLAFAQQSPPADASCLALDHYATT